MAAILFVGASVAMLFALQFYSAADVDRRDRERVEAVVDNGIRSYVAQASRKALPQAYWDDAVRHLDWTVDPKWASSFLGNYLNATAGIETVMVADRNDVLRFAYTEGREVPPTALSELARHSRDLITDVRLAEVRRGPMPKLPLAKGRRLVSVVASEIVEADGKLLLLSATLVQPDQRAAPQTARAPIIITAETLNARLADEISRQFLLDRAKLHIGNAPIEGGLAGVAIRDRNGQTLANLEWRASRPGTNLLRETLGATVGFSIMLGLMVAGFVFRGHRLAKALVISEAEAARLAYRDSLTGLANRAQFERAFADVAAASGSRGFALHSIDLDHFKTVNDSFGHPTGDELICAVANLLSGCVRPDDALIRFGGDEFLLLQARAGRKEASALAATITALLSKPIALQGPRVFTGASVGIALANRSQPASEWLRRADLALYVAKARGRGGHAVFDSTMDEGVRERQELSTRLHEALVNDRLDLVYQPQVGREGSIIGLEALARWSEPDLGPVAPARFVELAEESGMIDALGLFALGRAFADSRRWPDIRVAINVSALQLRQADFPARVETLAEAHAIDPGQFELEVTERVLLGEDPQTMASLRALRAMGFRIVLDDFGTGYSNLSSLQRYPIDKIKIDRSFVARIGHEPNAEALIVALVRLARALGLDVIAEGVETDAQRLCLTVAGCPDVQGFLTGRPMAADDAQLMIEEQADSADSATAS